MTRPRVLIEDWLPIEAIGVESKRERGASSALPPLYFLHVWWARRPLTTCRAAILGSVLPAWSPDWPAYLCERFPTEARYHDWFLQLNGISNGVVEARKILDWARRVGTSVPNPYSGPRAFTVNPTPEDLQIMGDLLEHTWGTRELSVLDPFAGGGSIPFEALRYGFTTIANDLNPVAAVILKATLEYPARFGPSLAGDIRKWGKRWYDLVKPKLQPYFTPLPPGAEGAAYLWARTVACPTTGKPVPLSPNWWLRRGSDPVAVQVLTEPHMDEPEFRIVRGDAVKQIDPDEGTVNRGNARSPWTGEVIDDDYIKSEAQAGRMGEILYAIGTKLSSSGFEFRLPTQNDNTCVRNASIALSLRKQHWISGGILPLEHFPEGNDNRPLIYGMSIWSDFFSSRQLLSIAVMLEVLQDLKTEISVEIEDKQRALAISVYLGCVISKCVDYDSRQTFWDPIRGIRHAFSRHDFAFRWNPAEFDASANLLPWATSQVESAFQDIANLASPSQAAFSIVLPDLAVDRLQIQQGSASHLSHIAAHTVGNITVDPPYYDNVQYAELSDFFYVWLKRSVGHLFPDLFTDELTNKDDEAVANPARFASLGGKKKDLAQQDYERKMAAAFREMHRVLRDDGVLTVMFTHKRVEAWDTLASALIGAGFTIHASWPVHTESEHSLHQAKKNAAASTILLVCRKREMAAAAADPVWWDDIKDRVRRVARAKAQEYMQQGIVGVDLYISTFGPTLSVISEQWPVLTSEVDLKSGEPIALRPEIALDLAREEVVRLRKEGLLAGRALTFDPVTDWYIMAWDAFQAEEFPFDEARKLAIALGLEIDELLGPLRLVAKKGQYVVIQRPSQRRKKSMVDPDAAIFAHLVDAVHTAMLIYDEDGAGACDVFLQNRGLKRDATFKAVLQALINAIPRTRIQGKFVRPEAEILDRMRLAFYAGELTAPPEEEPALPLAQQGGLFEGTDGDWHEGIDEEADEE